MTFFRLVSICVHYTVHNITKHLFVSVPRNTNELFIIEKKENDKVMPPSRKKKGKGGSKQFDEIREWYSTRNPANLKQNHILYMTLLKWVFIV